jgi:predicted SAM-dependent methyltransferase
LDEVYCCHTLEHFSTSVVPDILNDFRRILKAGGLLRVAVPDLDAICRCYVEHIDWFTPPHNPWLGLIYGGQTDPFDFHKTGFNLRWMQHLLAEAGFHDILPYQPEEICGLRDASFASEPFGISVSLNVMAVRG